MGADALAHGVSILSGCSWFSVRKEPKGHGRSAWVEGARLVEGDRVVIVEDVVSTGASLLKAVERVRDLGAEVVAATARCWTGALSWPLASPRPVSVGCHFSIG